MKSKRLLMAILTGGLLVAAVAVYLRTHGSPLHDTESENRAAGYVGSASCRECHERFYQLWAPSHHGTAMQPVTRQLADKALLPLTQAIQVGTSRYSVDLSALVMTESTATSNRTYQMAHAMGGKDVFFFLTPLDRGRLQVMPLAYDVQHKEWFDTTHSMIRHFGEAQDQAIDWQDPMLTFNTSCYNCHVSQLDKNYDPGANSYRTTWREPGINCESCHGPCGEHVEICRALPKGRKPAKLGLKSWKSLTNDQINDACAACHAKGRPIKNGFSPGNRYFDFHDLTCVEDRDFYPDGRDLGENFTQTGWMMSPCALSGKLNCIHCHTSSGRYRFKNENPNGACLPCHEEVVKNAASHSHHSDKTAPVKCIGCHMPMTEFGKMRRSDHSMRPPCPEAGIRFKSPVACIICHTEKSPQWAAAKVKEWHPDSKWQSKILREGDVIDAARKEQWARLPDILETLARPDTDPVMTTSLIRLLATCPDARKWEAIRRCASHASPLVRGAALLSLRDDIGTPETRAIIWKGLTDDSRLVRINAASSSARLPREQVPAEFTNALASAEIDLLASFQVMPDSWSGYYNLGNYHSDRNSPGEALEAFKRASSLRPDVVPPYVNASIMSSRLGRLPEGVAALQKAFQLDPSNGVVNLNLGLALAELNDMAGAESHLRRAVADPGTRAGAAYNLAVIVAARNPADAVNLCAMAAAAEPGNPRNAYTQAFYLDASHRTGEAIEVLRKLTVDHPAYTDGWMLLVKCYQKSGKMQEAKDVMEAMAGKVKRE